MRTVIGVFDEQPYAEESIAELTDRGYDAEDMSVLMKDRTVDAGTEMTKDVSGGLAKGATSGVATGAVVGGIAGLLVGMGALVIPGIGAFLVGGPLAVALGLTGAAATTVTGAATGAVAGGILGALMGLGLTREEAAAYEERIRAGALLVAIPVTAEQEDEVRSILERFNATDITSVSVPSDRIRTNRRAYQPVDRDIAYEDRDYDYSHPHATVGAKGGRSTRHTTSETKVRRKKRRVL